MRHILIALISLLFVSVAHAAEIKDFKGANLDKIVRALQVVSEDEFENPQVRGCFEVVRNSLENTRGVYRTLRHGDQRSITDLEFDRMRFEEITNNQALLELISNTIVEAILKPKNVSLPRPFIEVLRLSLEISVDPRFQGKSIAEVIAEAETLSGGFGS